MANYINCLLLILYVISACSAYLVDNNPYRHRITLDGQGKYQLEWLVDWDSKRITFNVTVATTGYVGFGLARKGKMAGADIVIGGVRQNGSPYFSDCYAIANQLPQQDPSQDWHLISARERRGETFLSFSRAFDTCDQDHDLPITQYDLTSVIWAYSEVDDEIQYHFQNRGFYDVYLLDPDLTPRGIEEVTPETNIGQNIGVYRITGNVQLKPQDTMYWCTFHRLPMTQKVHVIGFNTVFPTEQDRSQVHHIILHRCRAPPGLSPFEFFNGPSKSNGTECYVLDQPNSLPVPYCRETIHVWGVGGRPIFFPEHAGLPLAENERDEYLMFQVHYDNPSKGTDNVTVFLDLYHTTELRENEVGMFQLGDMQPGSTTIMIPPSETNHVVMGHCAPGCTERMLGPVGGANIFAAFLHTHLSGRGVRALHFRNGKELPWIQADDNYNFNYQQFRVLNREVKIEPGDLIIGRCVYDNTWMNGTAVTGGFSTREEMCTVEMYYYSRNPGFTLCRGEILTDRYFDFLGVGKNVTWNRSIRQTQITDPPQFAGMTMHDYVNNHINWNIQTRRELQKLQIFEPQTSHCPRFHWEDPQYQLEQQLRDQLPRTGRLPGSDGRGYTSVDDNFSFVSVYPRNKRRWMPEPQCSRRRPSGVDEDTVWKQQ